MVESLLSELHDPEAQQAVIDAILALFTRWHLHDVNQAQLLGLPSTPTKKALKPENLEAMVFTRMGNLLAIDRALNKYFRYQPKACDHWILQSQQQLAGETPLAVMLVQGDKGILKIRQLAESLLED